ncbi:MULTISPECIES: class F sortase [unclassified Streptomyces]|uniref:class F sortase n=1 Tax=unclassified Streptomyces TaxID=2593676 RepID=UPI0032549200
MSTPAEPGRPSSPAEDGRPRRIHRFHPARPRRLIAAIAVAAGMGLAGAGTSALVSTQPAPRHTAADIGALPPPQTAPTSPGSPAAVPERIRIPGISLDHSLTGLDVGQDGHLDVPGDPGQVGWWSDGPRPGDPGAAVFVGHVDSMTGPAAFYNISALRPGDEITIDRADRSHVTFTVRALRQYDKNGFPDDKVYVTTGAPALRLITCGGTYDREHGGYRDNVVVFATLTTPGHTTPTRSGN